MGGLVSSSDSVEYEFFWQSNEDPFKEGITQIWTPYEKSASLEIEDAYQIFLRDQTQNVFILNDQFKLDFKNWLQFNLKNPKEIQRPFKRDIPNDVLNIVRRNRFNEALVLKNQPKINLINCKPHDFENKMIVKKFDIFENKDFNLTMMVPCRFDFFQEKKLPKFSLYLELLKEEILSMGLPKRFKYNSYKKKLETISEDNFYDTMLFIYTMQDYLYGNLNSILREDRANNHPKIAYFYTALSASIRYFKKESIQMLEKEGKILHEQQKIQTKGEFMVRKRRFVHLYRCNRISKNEIDEYKKYENQPIIRQINEFFSTSIDSKVVRNFLESGTSNFQYFLKAKIPVYDEEINDDDFLGKNEIFVDFAYIPKHSNFGCEREVLIKSGTGFQVTKFQESQSQKNLFEIEVEVLSKDDIFSRLKNHETEMNKILKGCIIF